MRYFRAQIGSETYRKIYDSVLNQAFEHGDHGMAKEIYQKDLTTDTYFWMRSYWAGSSGNLGLIQMLQDSGFYNVLSGFQGSLMTGDAEIINYCWESAKARYPYETMTTVFIDYPDYMHETIIGGNPDIIKKVLPICDNQSGLTGAFASNRREWIAYFLDQGATVDYYCVMNAIKNCHLNLVQLYVSPNRLEAALVEAIAYQHNDIVRHLVNTYRSKINLRWAIGSAVRNYNWHAFEYFVSVADDSDVPTHIESHGFKEADEYLELWRQKRCETTPVLS